MVSQIISKVVNLFSSEFGVWSLKFLDLPISP